MAFAAPCAMWLYCTGTVLQERARLLTTQRERKEGNKANGESKKLWKKKKKD